MRLAGKIKHSFVNGPGTRYVVFFQGCPHHCPGCQNPDTHNFAGGYEDDISEVLHRIHNAKFLDGITLSGGEPFYQPEAAAEIAADAQKQGLSVWAYTGWTYEQLLTDPNAVDILTHVDILVDGPYIQTRRSDLFMWRGSSNQRLIDVRESRRQGRPIIYLPSDKSLAPICHSL